MCDETTWKVMLNGLLTWARMCTDWISVEATLDEKDAITAVASISASRKKLPLDLIAKGLTPRVDHLQLGPHTRHETDHSPSEWTTTATFTNYLHWLHRQ
jgi:hypothetical protein